MDFCWDCWGQTKDYVADANCESGLRICVEHGTGKCGATNIQKSDLKEAVVNAINLELGNKDCKMRVLHKNLETSIFQEGETLVEGINARLELQQLRK